MPGNGLTAKAKSRARANSSRNPVRLDLKRVSCHIGHVLLLSPVDVQGG